MKKFVSIKTKLITNTMITISLIFIVVLSVITLKDIRAVNKSIQKSEHNVRNSIIANGDTLANNNSMAMTGMAEDYAFTAIRDLVSSTVKEDADIVYGIYMDANYMPWAYATSENPSGTPLNNDPLTDEISQWAGSLKDHYHKIYTYDNEEVIEFAAPVRIDNEIAGFIRYGISTRSMHKALREALADGIRTRNTTIAILIFLGIISLLIRYLFIRHMADKITQPIESLVDSARKIAEGNYNIPVKSDSNDELGLLVSDVEKMRLAIKDLTDNLEAKVEGRTKQLQEATDKLAVANEEITELNKGLRAENLRLGAELDVARRLQQMVLPASEELDQIEGLEIVGFMEPADEVGGDYYDVLRHNGSTKISIGDVTGHGLESGVLMLMTQTAVRTLLLSGETDPVRFLGILNRVIYDNVQRTQIDKSLTLAMIDYKAGQVKLSGQHEEMIVVRKGGGIELVDTVDLGFPIGLDENIDRFVNETIISLGPGDGVVLYSDGITEAENTDKEFYGLQRLCHVISQKWDQSAEEIKQAVIDDVHRFIGTQERYDDLTLVVLKQR
ncbi:SpoIIE family protein phosphatase [Desulfococcaceae bacterium HSG8]|nr:SpoIIE family protein phosphatase [Desulfococcaceae bacterium HSG8]